MSSDPETTRIVRSWLEEGGSVLPDHVLDAVLDQLPATRQRRSIWPAWRSRTVSLPIRALIASAAVVLVAIVGFTLLSPSGGIGGRSVAPTPTPTPTPTAAPTASPSPTPTPSPTPQSTLPQSGELAPGTYRSGPLTFTVPAGWSAKDAWGVSKFGTDAPKGMFFAPWDIGIVYKDPCHWQTSGQVPVGTTVDDLVAAFTAQQRGAKLGAPVDITVGGYSGKLIDLMVPLNVTIAKCDGDMYKAWTEPTGGDRFNQGPGQHDRLAILDVNGKRLAIDQVYWPANTAADRAELKGLLDSATITPW